MEPSQQPIGSRRDKLNAHILGKIVDDHKLSLISRECLLDALQALFDECSIETLQKYDKQIAQFVEKYKTTIQELKRLRVNITDFEIKDVIGRGHFGEVHVVKEKQTGDIYAMKTIRKCDSLEKTSFDVERDIMALSQSAWITSLQYAFQDSIYLFFVMEYHPGGDLLGLLYRQGGTLPESAATFYLAEIVLALEDLHAMGFVHRDIKPDNILLDRCGHLKLVDFGSAARLNSQGFVDAGIPVGTPDYIAPEVLQSSEGKNSKRSNNYGVSCDYWSLGILAYELTIGKPPFTGQSTTTIYSRIMNHANTFKIPSDVLLTQAFISLMKGLITDDKSRLNAKQIKQHVLFKHLHFDTLRDQVPPYVPKITSMEDTSNFGDVLVKKSPPNVENFKKKTQFSGRNLPFIGFTFTHGFNLGGRDFERNSKAKDDIIKSMKEELEAVKRALMKSEDFEEIKLVLERKVMEKSHKLENIESVREKLERELAASMAESTALKRTLEIERKDRVELERKALDLIKSAKIKWETSERTKVEALNLEIEQQKEKITQLVTTNNMLNEQLQKAFKLEHKHKESLEAVEHMNRRSLVGLESRLEKVAVETRHKMINLQSSLDETTKQKRVLENENKELKERGEALTKRLEKSKEEYTVLNGAAFEAEKLVKELSEKVTKLEKDMNKSETHNRKIAELLKEIDGQKKKIQELDATNLVLKEENKTMEEFKNQIDALKEIKAQNERKINELESKLQEEEQKNASLKDQLVDADESQQLKEVRMKMWKIEKELGNAKIDKRILERELKDANKDKKELSDEINNLKTKIEENRKIHESAMLELNSFNETLSLELVKAREALKGFDDKLENEKLRNHEEKLMIVELKDTIKEKDSMIAEIASKSSFFKDEAVSLTNQLQKAEEEKRRIVEELDTTKQENQKLTDATKEMTRQLENNQTNLEALREACLIIENQVIEYEKINASIQAEKSSLAENTEKLIRDLCKAKEEIQDAKKLWNEEKSLRLLSENKVKRLSEDVECLQNECQSYKEQCLKYKECSNQLSDELTLSEEKVSDLEVTVKSYERQIEEFITENNLLKEEISQYLTQMGGMKEANFKLKQQIQDLKSAKNVLIERGDELESLLNAKITYYEEREMKHESIIKQQTKLIDYLQVKIEEHSHKKKTLTDKLFGSKKENQPPIALPVNYKDLENQLQKQKQMNKELQEEIYKLKSEMNCVTKITRHRSEIVSPKTKLAMEQLSKSPAPSKSELFKQNSIQRMYHNIPHRFVTKLCKKLSKCDHCANQITLGRDVSVCTECNINVHVNCTSSVKSTCGLPQAYAKHYKDSLTKLNSDTNAQSSDDVSLEGWIKVLSKNNSWEKRYACLTDSHLNIYLNSVKNNLVESVDLKVANCKKKIVLEPLPSEIGVNVASSDLPFILKIEISTDCWPVVSVVFMALSMADRDKWYKALETLFCDASDRYHLESIVAIPDQIYANCILDVTKTIKVLGTDQGLYAYHNNLLHIEGPTEVHHICVIPESTIVVMISGLTSVLTSCDLNHLINLTQCAPCTKPILKHRNIAIKDLDGFHYLQASSFGRHQMFCAATSKQLVVVKYEEETDEFVPLRIMDTAEPLSCGLFTEHSLIVGADKFFEIDLASFKAEEFLDSSDSRLKHAVKCHKMQSFPVAILQVFDNPKEYLLCFNEFSLFVDEYGRCSRPNEIRTSYLPIGFHFVAPFLFIIQFSGVQIFRLSPNDVDNCPNVVVELKKMRYLGRNRLGIYVFHEGKVKFLEGRKLVECDDCTSVVSQSTEMEESDRFSFTSSIVQSLDGNLSDAESSSVEESTRRVKFSQTNL